MTAPLRIGHFLYHYPEPGGTSRAVDGLSRALARLGHTVAIYGCGVADTPCCTETENPQLRWFHPSLSHPFHIPRALRLWLLENRDRLDLLVLHGSFNPRNFTLARLARRARIPAVACPHGLYHPELFRKRPLTKLLYGVLFERPMLNSASAVQVFDEYQIQFLRDYGVRKPVMVIPNGFDPEEVPQLGECNGRRRRPVQLLYLGRIDPHTKGLDLLLQAMSLGLRERTLPEDLRLDIAGPDAGGRTTLMRLVDRLGISRNVRFPGGLSARERWFAIASADVLVLTSRHDAFPTVVLEAMAVAKPVVVSENTGISSWVRKARCGILVQPTPRSIAAGLARMMELEHQWTDMGQRGRKLAYSRLTWDRVAEHASVCYQELMEGQAE